MIRMFELRILDSGLGGFRAYRVKASEIRV